MRKSSFDQGPPGIVYIFFAYVISYHRRGGYQKVDCHNNLFGIGIKDVNSSHKQRGCTQKPI